MPHLPQPSQPTGRKSTHTGSFLFHWPKELSTLGSSISLLGNLHPQITLSNSPLYTSGDRISRFRESSNQVSYSSDPRNLNYRAPMFSHQKKSIVVIPCLIQWSTRLSRIESSRLSIPKSLVDANPEFPSPDVNFSYLAFVSLRVTMSCNSAPRPPKS
jgi:hypothetical protein